MYICISRFYFNLTAKTSRMVISIHISSTCTHFRKMSSDVDTLGCLDCRRKDILNKRLLQDYTMMKVIQYIIIIYILYVYLYIFQLLVVGDRAFPVLHKISAYTGEFTKRDQVSAVCYTICSLSVYLSANRQLRLHPFRECPCASISIFMVVIVNVFN